MPQSHFTPEVLDELLGKLSTDDEFRENFLGNPALVFSALGVPVDPSQIPAVRHLPPKAELAANADAIKSKLVGGSVMMWFLVK